MYFFFQQNKTLCPPLRFLPWWREELQGRLCSDPPGGPSASAVYHPGHLASIHSLGASVFLPVGWKRPLYHSPQKEKSSQCMWAEKAPSLSGPVGIFVGWCLSGFWMPSFLLPWGPGSSRLGSSAQMERHPLLQAPISVKLRCSATRLLVR